jgi:hypothetical protein
MDYYFGNDIFKTFGDDYFNRYERYGKLFEKTTQNINTYFSAFTLIYGLTQFNYKAINVLSEMQKIYLDDNIMKEFYNKLLDNNITGERLLYIYENECNNNVELLMNIDLKQFTDEYFYVNM